MKFTKGPWRTYKAINYDGYAIAPRNTLPTLAAVERCGAGKISVECFNFEGEVEANAHLIAAAPELYEIVADILKDDGAEQFIGSGVYQQAKAVLAKARGES